MIYRVEKTIKDVITLHKYPILEDTRLSWKAKGLLTYLLGHGDGWNCHEEDLYHASPDGMGVIKSGLKELRAYGYIEKRPLREQNRISGWESVIREIPSNIETQWGQPTVSNPPDEIDESKKVEKQEGRKARRLKSKKVENLPSRESSENCQEPPEIKDLSKKVGFQQCRKHTDILILNKEINTDSSNLRNAEKRTKKTRHKHIFPSPDDNPYGEYQQVYLSEKAYQSALKYFHEDEQELQFWIQKLDLYLKNTPEKAIGGKHAYVDHGAALRTFKTRNPGEYQCYLASLQTQTYQQRASPTYSRRFQTNDERNLEIVRRSMERARQEEQIQ